jgi:hypothetical protein
MTPFFSNPKQRGFLLLIFILGTVFLSARSFLAQGEMEALLPGPGVAEVFPLSTWHAPLKYTRSDCKVFLLEGRASLESEPSDGDHDDSPRMKEAGGTILVLGGVHPNEPAGYLAAVVMLENLIVEKGKVWLIPRTNASAFSATEPQEGHPQTFTLPARDGSLRTFRLGSRLTNPLDQWPDPEIAIHYPSGQTLSGNETRNLNRCFPGRPDGNRTEQVAWALKQFIIEQKIDLVIDLHEASIEYPVINALIAHETAGDLAAAAMFDLEMKGLKFNLEPSPKNLHGLSHRELGDFIPGLFATLMESANPIQGRLRGKTGRDQIIKGLDPCYVKAGEAGMNQVPFDSLGIPIERRVMRHIEGLKSLVASLDWVAPEKTLRLSGLPAQDDLLRDGLSPFLTPNP